jgi:lambda family phage tail tape measure protein
MDIVQLKFSADTSELDTASKKLDDVKTKTEQTTSSLASTGDAISGAFGRLSSLPGPIGQVMGYMQNLTDSATRAFQAIGLGTASTTAAATAMGGLSAAVGAANTASVAATGANAKLVTSYLAVKASADAAAAAQSRFRDINNQLAREVYASARAAGASVAEATRLRNEATKAAVGQNKELAGLTQATDAATTSMSGFGRAAAFGAAGIVGFAGAALAGYLAINRFTLGVALAAADADELAQQLGITVDELNKLKLITSENGGSAEQLVKVYDKLSRSMSKFDDDNERTVQAFTRLGISMDDIQNKRPEEVAALILRNYELLGKGVRETAAVTQLLGPNFRDLSLSIKENASSAQDATARLREYGVVADQVLIQRGNEHEKSVSNLKLAWDGLKQEIARSTLGMTSDIAGWTASTINSIRQVLAELRRGREAAGAVESISQERRNQLLAQAKEDVLTADRPNATLGDVNKRFQELLSLEIAMNAKRKSEALAYVEVAKKAEDDAAAAKARGVAATGAAAEAEKKRAESAARERERLEKERLDQISRRGMFELKLQDERDRADEESARAYFDFISKRGLEDLRRADAAEAAAEREYQSLLKRIQGYKELANPVQRYQDQLEQLNADLATGLISNDLYTATVLKIVEAMKKSLNVNEEQSQSMLLLQRIGESAFKSLEDTLVNFALNGSFSFKSFVSSVLKDIARLIIQIQLIGPLMKALEASMKGGSFLSTLFKSIGAVGGPTASAYGNVFDKGLLKSADGNIFGKPTLHGYRGGIGMLGEAGPEGILPLKRNSTGQLGVIASGMGGGSNTVNNITINVQGGSTNQETGVVLSQAIVNTMKQIARGEIITARRPGGLLTA